MSTSKLDPTKCAQMVRAVMREAQSRYPNRQLYLRSRRDVVEAAGLTVEGKGAVRYVGQFIFVEIAAYFVYVSSPDVKVAAIDLREHLMVPSTASLGA